MRMRDCFRENCRCKSNSRPDSFPSDPTNPHRPCHTGWQVVWKGNAPHSLFLLLPAAARSLSPLCRHCFRRPSTGRLFSRTVGRMAVVLCVPLENWNEIMNWILMKSQCCQCRRARAWKVGWWGLMAHTHITLSSVSLPWRPELRVVWGAAWLQVLRCPGDAGFPVGMLTICGYVFVYVSQTGWHIYWVALNGTLCSPLFWLLFHLFETRFFLHACVATVVCREMGVLFFVRRFCLAGLESMKAKSS